jgi:hypothetical protein
VQRTVQREGADRIVDVHEAVSEHFQAFKLLESVRRDQYNDRYARIICTLVHVCFLKL